MFKFDEIPIFLYFLFTLIYSVIGNNELAVWNGLFFCFNYMAMAYLFHKQKSRFIRWVGVSLSFSLFLFSVTKFFPNFTIEKYYTLVPFSIILFGFFYLNKRK